MEPDTKRNSQRRVLAKRRREREKMKRRRMNLKQRLTKAQGRDRKEGSMGGGSSGDLEALMPDRFVDTTATKEKATQDSSTSVMMVPFTKGAEAR